MENAMSNETSAPTSPLSRLHRLGQSVWLHFIPPHMVRNGDLARLVRDDAVTGLTSNPAIFEKAIAGSTDYDADIAAAVREGLPAAAVYERLAVQDIREAADVLRPVYSRTRGGDGYVSLEVQPHLARDAAGTVTEARRLWQSVGRPNVFIKIPGTAECLPAIRQCIDDGINVNVTLLFSLQRYLEVIDAYLVGLEARAARGDPVNRVASVASFFLSRIDVLADPMLEKIAAAGGTRAGAALALVSQAAIASAKVAYQLYLETFAGERPACRTGRWQRLADKGARVQRLLWASTSTKNPAYPDTKYVEPLIGRQTINTMPPETVAAYRDHGDPVRRLTKDVPAAYAVLARLGAVGVDLAAVTRQLEVEGIEKFNKPYDALLEALRKKGSS
jgi:transaldolase